MPQLSLVFVPRLHEDAVVYLRRYNRLALTSAAYNLTWKKPRRPHTEPWMLRKPNQPDINSPYENALSRPGDSRHQERRGGECPESTTLAAVALLGLRVGGLTDLQHLPLTDRVLCTVSAIVKCLAGYDPVDFCVIVSVHAACKAT
jgi:hypothetical protein